MQLTFLTLDDFTQELSAQGVSTVRVDALERIQSQGETPPRRIGEIVATARLDENTVAAVILRILDEPATPQTPTDLVRCGDNARQAIELLSEYRCAPASGSSNAWRRRAVICGLSTTPDTWCHR